MESKKVLEELETRYNKLEEEYIPLREDAMNLEGTPEYDEYMACVSDEEKNKRFPEQYAMFKKKEQLEEELIVLDKEIFVVANDISKNLDQYIAALEDRIASNQEQRDELEQETTALKEEIKNLKSSEAYLNGDGEAIKQLQNLEEQLKKNRSSKGKITRNINAFKKEIDEIKEEKQEIMAMSAYSMPEEESVNEAKEPQEEQDTLEEQNRSHMEEFTIGDDEINFVVPEPVPEVMKEFVIDEPQIDEVTMKAKQNEAKEIIEKISQKQEQINEEIKQHNQAVEGIRKTEARINFLKSTDEYKNNDENVVRMVADLENELSLQVIAKDAVRVKIDNSRNELRTLVESKQKLVEQYGQEVLKYVKDGEKKFPEHEEEQKERKEHKDKGDKEQREQHGKPKYDPKKHTKLTGYKTGEGDEYTSYIPSAGKSDSKPEKDERETKEEPEKEIEKIIKKEFTRLYAKARTGKITEQEFMKLATIMGNEAYYDKFNITTGVIFNKARVLLKAMANMTADTNKTAILSRERLKISVKEVAKGKGYMPTKELKNWSGLKTLIENPSRKIASEEMFKNISMLDRTTLNNEQLEVWNKAQEHLKKFEDLRKSLAVYEAVSQSRSKKSVSWFNGSKKEEAKPLPEATAAEPRGDIYSEMKELTYINPDLSRITGNPRTVSDPEKTIGGNK